MALMVAALPLLARLAYWWISRPRPERAGAGAFTGSPAAWERTEVRMQKRLFGRWRIRVTSTRWAGPPPATGGRRGGGSPWWLRLALPLGGAGLPRPAPTLPRLSAPLPGGVDRPD